MSSLNIIKEKEEVSQEALKQEEFRKFTESLLYFENKTELKLVLKRIDPSTIFNLTQTEEEFHKNYKSVHNERISKEKRETKLKEKRQEMLDKSLKAKDLNRKYKIYDANIKDDKGQSVVYCNGKPMIVKYNTLSTKY